MMKIKNELIAMLALGVIVFTAQTGDLRGQARAPAYVITEIEVTDAEAFKEYAPQVQSSFMPFGGRYLVRGGETQSLAGDSPKRVVVLAFDSIGQAQAWYASSQYEALKALRDKAGRARIFAVEGLAP
jgi:uncharacterized protein (DUF1330 family)